MAAFRFLALGQRRSLIGATMLCGALALALAVALGAAQRPRALDSLGDIPSTFQSIERPGENFTGSAFFFAADAFAPAPEVRGTATPHVYPLLRAPLPATRPLIGATAQDRYRALTCLTAAIYYEAANEPDEGQRAVAQVVLNRVRHPAWPNSVCGVVYQGAERSDLLCQFSFACDGSLVRLPMNALWTRAQRVAALALAGERFAPVGTATYYHSLAVRPGWAATLNPVAVVGAHIFYIMRGGAGDPSAFSAYYAGHEPPPGPPPTRFALPASMKNAPLPEAALPAEIFPLPAPSPAPFAPQRKAPAPQDGRSNLPESTIRPEYRNTGRPLFQE